MRAGCCRGPIVGGLFARAHVSPSCWILLTTSSISYFANLRVTGEALLRLVRWLPLLSLIPAVDLTSFYGTTIYALEPLPPLVFVQGSIRSFRVIPHKLAQTEHTQDRQLAGRKSRRRFVGILSG